MKEKNLIVSKEIKNSKLNLPSAWTKKKMASLFLMTWLSVNGVNSGENFKECVGYSSLYSQYDTVVNFAKNIADKQSFCCNVPIGSTDVGCSPLSPDCPYNINFQGQCNTVDQSKFCVTRGSYLQSALGNPSIQLPGDLCGGIIGNTSPTNATVGECPDLNAIGNTLVNQRTAETFSWLCCSKDNCKVPANVKLSDGSAITGCSSNEWSLMCFNDNGGWSCTGNVSPNIENIALPIGSCVEQVVFSGSETVPSSSDNAKPTGSKNSPQSTGSKTSESENDNGLSNSDKIAIGLGVPGFFVAVFGAWVTYKQLKASKEKKERARVAQNETELNVLGEGNSQAIRREAVNNQIRQPQYQAQVEQYTNYPWTRNF